MSKTKPKHLVMIVGMHRSGTSAVGRLLENIGFEFGNNLLEGIYSINDDGFWEDKEVIALNEHIFQLYDFNWFDFERMPGKWWEDVKIKELVGVAETWYYESFSGEKAIAVKDPRFCRLLPFWKRVFQGLDLHLHILFVYRHPVEVAASLKKRDGFPLQLGYLLWLSYTIDALYYSRNLSLSIINYEEMLKEPDRVINRLLREDIPYAPLASEIDIKDISNKSIHASRHHQKSEALLKATTSAGDIELLATELFEELLTATPDFAKGLADKYRKRLYRILDHHKEILSALREGIHNQVDNSKKLFNLGDEHSHALAVIREKDAQLEENKGFITRCLEEIQSKDSQIKSSQENPHVNSGAPVQDYAQKFDNWMADLSKLVDDYKSHIEEQKKYIAECNEKIAFQEKGLADNQEYIAKCHARIAEQDVGIAENRGYISACEDRIRMQDEGLVNRDKTLDEKLNHISDLEKSIALLNDQAKTIEKNLSESSEKNSRLNDEIFSYSVRLKENAEYISNSNARMEQQEAYISEYRSQLKISEEKLSANILRVDFLERSFAELQQQLDRSSGKLQATEENLRISRIRNEELERISLAQQQQLGEYAERVRVSEEALKASQARIEELDGVSRTQQQQLGEYTEKLRSGEEAMTASQMRVASLDSALFELNSLLSERDRNLHENKLLIEQNIRNINEKEVILTEKIQLLDSTNQRVSEFSAEIDRLRGLDAVNHQRLALQKMQLEKFKAHSAALESEMVALRAEHEERVRQLQRYRSYRMVKVIDKLFPET